MTPVVRKLNQLLEIHVTSFASYVLDVGAWNPGRAADEDIAKVLQNVGRDQRALADRIYTAILDRGGPFDYGSYPMSFTDKNDLTYDRLLREVADFQHRDTAAIERIAASLEGGDVEALELAQEALGSAKAHQDALDAVAACRPA